MRSSTGYEADKFVYHADLDGRATILKKIWFKESTTILSRLCLG